MVFLYTMNYNIEHLTEKANKYLNITCAHSNAVESSNDLFFSCTNQPEIDPVLSLHWSV